jgi:hypothetical protein
MLSAIHLSFSTMSVFLFSADSRNDGAPLAGIDVNRKCGFNILSLGAKKNLFSFFAKNQNFGETGGATTLSATTFSVTTLSILC